MVTWSRLDLENWADAILEAYLKEKYYAFAPIDLLSLAMDYLGLTVRYETLSDDLDIYGISVFQETTLTLKLNGQVEEVQVEADTILLEENLLQPHLKGVHRFTQAHEVAHQILTRWEQRDQMPAVAYSRPGMTRNWREWQADTLGSCLLMPRRLVDECLFRFGLEQPIEIFDRYYLLAKDRIKVASMANFLGVSKAALLNRLVSLGAATRRPIGEYMERVWL